MKKLISTTLLTFLNENNIENILYRRTNSGNIEAVLDGKTIGELSLNDYWTELEYIDDINIKNNIVIPSNFEFVGMIQSDIENKGIATNMIKYAISTSTKNGIAISKLFIADEAVYTIMKKLNAKSIPDWYLLIK